MKAYQKGEGNRNLSIGFCSFTCSETNKDVQQKSFKFVLMGDQLPNRII